MKDDARAFALSLLAILAGTVLLALAISFTH